MSKLALLAGGCALLAFVYLVWPTPYRYTVIKNAHGAQAPVRINRFTGEAEMFVNIAKGWEGRNTATSSTKEK